ncbi:MAG: hypothetical protein GXC70_06975 [Sphingomonadaceae bacterium]|nr:hypothetical protein [Sphingomonadaceae bacterium]
MVDYFALALSHGLLALAGWKLLTRADLDADPAPPADQADGQDAAAKPPKPGQKRGLRLRA